MQTKEHYYQIDQCRIVAMMGILSLHLVSKAFGAKQITTSNSWILNVIQIYCYCSVDLFALMSGFLGAKKMQQKTYRLIELLSIVVFYCLAFTIFFLIFKPELLSDTRSIFYSLCPPLMGRLWYITCYIPLFLFQPYLNRFLNELTIDQHKKLCIISGILLGAIPCFLATDFFKTNTGYSFVWLAVCYNIGAYLGRVQYKMGASTYASVFVGGGILLWIFKMVMDRVFKRDVYYLINYQSPIILLMAVTALMFFYRLKIRNKKLMAFSVLLAECTFDVYIIHCHPVIYELLGSLVIWEHISTLPSPLFLLTWVCIMFCVYILCSLVGVLRKRLFCIVHLDVVFEKISKRVDYLLKV